MQGEPRILAIDPGTRYFGLAVLEESELIYQGVEEIKGHRSRQKVLGEGRRLVEGMIRDFRPGTLAIEDAFVAGDRNGALMKLLIEEICAVGRKCRLSVSTILPSTVKQWITGSGRATKGAVAQAVAVHYPELEAFLGEDSEWNERYYSHMFDAVALGIVVSVRAKQRSMTHRHLRSPHAAGNPGISGSDDCKATGSSA